jgi:hypothetical protein
MSSVTKNMSERAPYKVSLMKKGLGSTSLETRKIFFKRENYDLN